MSSARDSGVIDLFAIHKEEEARLSAATPSGPPPAVSFDTGPDEEVDGFAAAQQKSRQRVKVIGGAIGVLSVLGILVAAMTAGGGESEKAAAAAAAAPPPPPAVTAPPPPAAEPPAPPAPVPPPPATAKAKPDYTRATAAAAYAASQGKKKSSATKKSVGGGVKLQKVQSSGIPQ